MWKANRKSNSRNPTNARDIVIPVIGLTGAGKSTFINTALGQALLEVGHDLTTCTTQPCSVVIDPIPGFPSLKGYRLVLVDTPGLDGTYEDDDEILDRIMALLENSYRKNMNICGIIYLYDMSHDRFSRVDRMNLEKIDRLCKDAALGKVVLATTNLGNVFDKARERRKNDLINTLWKSLIEGGAEVRHFQGDSISAWQIIEVFLRLAEAQRRPIFTRLAYPVVPRLSHLQPIKDPFQAQSRHIGRVIDTVLEDGKKTDIVIPIMGPTGAGKSTFINTALEKEELEVGHNLTSCTTQLQPIVIDPIPGFPHLKGHRLVLVDTPGFNDTFIEDAQVLADIATWLADSYRKEMVIVGILYLHDISLKRFTGTARQNLEMFCRICGDAALNKVILATTNWGIVSPEADERHESEMRATHWTTIIDQGADVHRFLGDSTSAWDIINVFLKRADAHRNNSSPLQIQREIVDDGKTIHDTKAGKFLRTIGEKLTNVAQMRCIVQ